MFTKYFNIIFLNYSYLILISNIFWNLSDIKFNNGTTKKKKYRKTVAR